MPAASAPAASPAPRLNARVLILGAVVVLPLLAVLIFNLGRDPHSVRSPLIGQPAPAFSLRPVGGGSPVDLASLRGRPAATQRMSARRVWNARSRVRVWHIVTVA